MEVCIPRNTSAYGSPAVPLSPTDYCSGDLSMNDLKACLTEFLNNGDLEISTGDVSFRSRKYDLCNVDKEDKSQEFDKISPSSSTVGKCFGKCVKFTRDEPESSVNGLLDGEIKQDDESAEASKINSQSESVIHCHSQSISLPTPLKLISAMKGSRDKPKDLSVTWAPDVYDPTPTAVSHAPSNRNHRYHNTGKKYGKSKQKVSGKSSRGSKGKEKKQSKKHTGSSTKKFKNQRDDTGVNCYSEPQMGFLDFNVETSDHFAGVVF